MGDDIGLGLNPAREVASRLVVSGFTGSWEVLCCSWHLQSFKHKFEFLSSQSFLESNGWVWIPVSWSFAGALIGALLFWLLLEIPRQCESQDLEEKTRKAAEEEEETLIPVLITEKPVSTSKPPPPPPLPSSALPSSAQSSAAPTSSAQSSSAQWPQACFPARSSRDETRASQLSRQLERYQSVSLDKKDEAHTVTITVGGEEEEKKKFSL